MKRYTQGEVREGFRVVVKRFMDKGPRRWLDKKTSIYEECETNERCLTEALTLMDDNRNRQHGVEIQIEEFYDDSWSPVVAFAWDDTKRTWRKLRVLSTGSTENARVRVALVVPGEPNVMVQDCGDEVGDCYRVLADLRESAALAGAQLHVQVRHPTGAWASHRYEEFRLTGHGRGKWVMVAMPSELVYLRNRRAR